MTTNRTAVDPKSISHNSRYSNRQLINHPVVVLATVTQQGGPGHNSITRAIFQCKSLPRQSDSVSLFAETRMEIVGD